MRACICMWTGVESRAPAACHQRVGVPRQSTRCCKGGFRLTLLCALHFNSSLIHQDGLLPPSLCRTYLANDNGAAAAFDLVCKEAAGAGSSSNTCPTWCPRMDRTHEYFNYQLFEIDCQDQKAAAGVKGRRRLHADPKAASTQRLYLATISKVETNAPRSQGYVRAAGSSQCEQVARTCPALR